MATSSFKRPPLYFEPAHGLGVMVGNGSGSTGGSCRKIPCVFDAWHPAGLSWRPAVVRGLWQLAGSVRPLPQHQAAGERGRGGKISTALPSIDRSPQHAFKLTSFGMGCESSVCGYGEPERIWRTALAVAGSI